MHALVEADVHVAHGAEHGEHAAEAVAYVPGGHVARHFPLNRTRPDAQLAHADGPAAVHAEHSVSHARQTDPLLYVPAGQVETHVCAKGSSERPEEHPVHVSCVPLHVAHGDWQSVQVVLPDA